MYLSATEASQKFNISKRFIEILCDRGELEGAICIGGIWLIPDTATMPDNVKSSEDQLSFDDIAVFEAENYYTTEQVCDILSISEATAKNWIKLKKLIPDTDGGNFSKEYIERLVADIKNGSISSLKSRRNKKSIGGKSLYRDYIGCENNIETVKSILSECESITEQELRLILAHFAIQLYKNNGEETINGNKWYKKHLPVGKSEVFNSLIFDLIGDIDLKSIDISAIKPIFDKDIEYVPTEDTLGFIYISLRDIGNRKGTGTYFTPQSTVRTLIDGLQQKTKLSSHSFCDPCCGTGNFLIELLNRGVEINKLYGYDIDAISVTIAKINIFLCCKNVTRRMLDTHIIATDSLNKKNDLKFSVVLGNPPWGYNFSDAQNKQLASKFITAREKNSESFELFIEKGLNILEDGGHLAYLLPESIMNVNTHLKTRKFITDNCHFEFAMLVGNIFSGVQCPAVILGIKKQKGGNTAGCTVTDKDRTFTICTQRDANDTEFSFYMNDEEYECFNVIKNTSDAIYLKDNAVFALGIVTGNNKKYISDEKKDGYEVVLKGSDISRYSISKPKNYIMYLPDEFQQTAPENIYRAKEKLIYRFISDMPVFAYDSNQTLTLNSCNILIPTAEGIDIKYLLAILNSSVTAFYMTKRFNSLKLLRSHIEQLPIPLITESKQREIVRLADKIISAEGNKAEIYNEIDVLIMNAYDLSQEQRTVIKKALGGKKECI